MPSCETNLDRPGRVPGTRELLAHRHDLLIYDLDDQRIRILRVMHTARQYWGIAARRATGRIPVVMATTSPEK